MELAKRIIEYRAKHGLSQRAFAKKAKLTPQTVCFIENGKEPSKITRAKIELAMEEN